MKKLKKFEDYTVVNASSLMDTNLSSNYHVNKSKGKNPYTKIEGGILVEVDTKKSIPKDALYLTPQQVEDYNKITQEIIKLNNEREKLFVNREEIIK